MRNGCVQRVNNRRWVALVAVGMCATAGSTLAQPIPPAKMSVDGVSGASYTVPMPSRPPPAVLAEIQQWLQTHWFMSLATASPDGVPHVSGVTFYAENNKVYFRAKKSTSKIVNIMANPRVSYTVWDGVADMSELKAVQVTGVARILEGDERTRIGAIFSGAPGTTASNLEKFFQQNGIQPLFSGEKSLQDDMAVVEVRPIMARFNDNTLGMGHSEVYRFAESAGDVGQTAFVPQP